MCLIRLRFCPGSCGRSGSCPASFSKVLHIRWNIPDYWASLTLKYSKIEIFEVCTWIKCISIVFEKPVPCKQFEYSLVLGFDIGLYPRFRRPFSNFWFCLCLTSGKNPNFWLQSSSDSEIQSRFSNSTLKSQITSWPNSIRKRTKKHIQVVSVYGPFPIWFCPDGQSTTAKTYWSSKSSAFEQFIKINMPKNWIFRSLPSLSCLNSFATVQGTNEYADFIGKLMLTKQL